MHSSTEKMSYRPLGRCGTKVSVFGLGGWTTFGGSVTDKRLVQKIIRIAFESGINFFDIADVYSKGQAEELMGEALRDFPRHELVISSKVYFPVSDDVNDRGLSRKHIMESIERSLKRIGTDYLDVYFCHRFDEETPVEETVRAMDDLVHQGKILYWGTSEWTGDQIRKTALRCEAKSFYPPQVEQPQYSLVSRKKLENETLPTLRELGMGIVVWSPLGSGILTGKYDQGLPEGSRLQRIEWLQGDFYNERVLARVRKMKELADQAGCSRAQLALAWAAAQPGISSVITGATKPEQLQENLGALRVNITDDVRRRLEELFPVG
jgi:voltage-dependent potassium channel beta subunit